MNAATEQITERNQKQRRLEELAELGDTRTKDEDVEMERLYSELNPPVEAPKPARRRTPREAIEAKRKERTAIFPLTVLLDTDKGTYQYLNSQTELDENAGAVLREPERFVIIQGERKSPAVNWK